MTELERIQLYDKYGNPASPVVSSETVMHKGEPMSQALSRIVSSAGIQGNVGEIFWWPLDEPPDDALVCDGREIDREEYADLFAVIGIKYGNGDGVDTFNLPDMRGEFVRGYDPANERDPELNRDLGSHQDGTGIPWLYTHNASIVVPASSNVAVPTNKDSEFGGSFTENRSITGVNAWASYGSMLYTSRPTNISMLPCIRYKIKVLPWCKGYFQDRSISINTSASLTPIVTAGDASFVSGNNFIIDNDGWYLISINGGGISSVVPGSVNIQTYIVDENSGKKLAGAVENVTNIIPCLTALLLLAADESFYVNIWSSIAQSTISGGGLETSFSLVRLAQGAV